MAAIKLIDQSGFVASLAFSLKAQHWSVWLVLNLKTNVVILQHGFEIEILRVQNNFCFPLLCTECLLSSASLGLSVCVYKSNFVKQEMNLPSIGY